MKKSDHNDPVVTRFGDETHAISKSENNTRGRLWTGRIDLLREVGLYVRECLLPPHVALNLISFPPPPRRYRAIDDLLYTCPGAKGISVCTNNSGRARVELRDFDHRNATIHSDTVLMFTANGDRSPCRNFEREIARRHCTSKPCSCCGVYRSRRYLNSRL